MRKKFGKKAVAAACVCMAAVALLVTLLTLQGILELGREDSGRAEEPGSSVTGSSAGVGLNAPAGVGAANKDGGKGLETAAANKAAKDGGQSAVAAAADGNWGLSFQQEGKAPIGNATSEYLKKYNAYYIGGEKGSAQGSDTDGGKKTAGKQTAGTGNTGAGKQTAGTGNTGAGKSSGKTIYLTFDAGYGDGYTVTPLDMLKEEKVPAAFFVGGNFIGENPERGKRMADEGHIVGNHTMHHPDMSAISDEAGFRKEMSELEAAYKAAVGADMLKFYRPPQGKYSERNLEMANRMGYTTVFWSLAYVDWLQDSQPSREEALNILNKRIHPGAIVLLHSTSKTNAEILRELLQGWKAQGYVFKPISELGVRKF